MPQLFTGARAETRDDNGLPYSNGKLYFYETGTSTLKDTYSDAALTIPNSNPVVLDAAGRSGPIFLSGAYKVILKNSSDVTVYEQDNFTSYSEISASDLPTSNSDLANFTTSFKVQQTGTGAVYRNVDDKLKDIVSAADFLNPFTGDITDAVNAAIDSLGVNGGTVIVPKGAYTVSGQTDTSPNSFAVADGDSVPDAPENSAILLREKKNITLDMSGCTITSGNAYAVCFYKSSNCHVIGQPKFIYSGTLGSSQPAAITMIRSLYCSGTGIADGFYRSFYGLKNACCNWYNPVALNSNYFAIYMSGLLDVSVDSNSDWVGVKWTNKVFNGIARNCKFGSYFCEYTEMWYCQSYDIDNSTAIGNHYSLQTGPYRAYYCSVEESADLNSGNVIRGFVAAGTSTSKTSATDTIIHGCKINGCYIAISTAGGENVKITDNEYKNYYATGIAVVTATDYPVDNIVISSNIDKGLNASSTRTASGDVKIASIQLEKNGADITNPLVSNNVVNLDRAGTVTPAGTAYEIYCENVTNLKAPSTNMILGTQGTLGFVDTNNGVVTMDVDDTTPSVSSRNAANVTFMTSQANTGATAITQFDDAVAGQTVVFRVGSATNAPTLADGGNFVLNSAFNLTLNDTITLYTGNGTTWYEVSRSDN